MADSIMDSILAAVSPEMRRALATRLGASTASVESGLAGACADSRRARPAARSERCVRIALLRTAAPLVLASLRTAAGRPMQSNAPPPSVREVEGAVPPRWLVPSAWTALGELMRVQLPDGIVLNVPALGVEARLVKYLSENSARRRDSSWFDFDRLLFDNGKATLQAASQEQLTNIAAILKAYPQVSIRIGGYTDNTGDPAANLHLSDERANNVMDELVKLGIHPARMSARGYGQRNPLADNSSEEGRQRNRRISLRVAGKQTAV